MKFFSLIYQGEIHTHEERKVIPEQEFTLLLTAQEILEKAREDAKRFEEETAEECARLKEEAQKKGFDKGLEEFNEQLLNFEKKLKKLHHDTYLQIFPIALKAAKKIVAKELEQHPDTIVDIVMQAIAPVTQAQRITIYVNKADKETLEAERPQIKEILEHVKTLSIQERGDIAAGGCIIETEAGIINATLENQWRALEAAFERYKK